MKIVAPLSHRDETEMLLHMGADEIYCGIARIDWDGRYGGQVWMNRRDPKGANVASIDDITEVTGIAHEEGAKVYVTLNSPYYPKAGLAYIMQLSERLVERADVDGLIVSDMNLLIRLSKEKFPVRIHLSSLGNAINAESVEFYSSLGVNRIILPRHLRLSEIEALVKKCRKHMEFEVFAINDGCYFEESFCRTSHAGGSFCMAAWTAHSGRGENEEMLEEEMKHLREFLWYQNNCGCTFQEDGLPNGPCSLCWFGRFRDWGISAVKIVGREASFYRKMRSLQLVKAVMDRVRQKDGWEMIEETARRLRNTPEYCEKGYMCYFREN